MTDYIGAVVIIALGMSSLVLMALDTLGRGPLAERERPDETQPKKTSASA